MSVALAVMALAICPGIPVFGIVSWYVLKRAYENGFRDGYGSARWDMGKRRER